MKGAKVVDDGENEGVTRAEIYLKKSKVREVEGLRDPSSVGIGYSSR